MERCEGDCDNNNHCGWNVGSGLKCFQRNNKRAIPGCISGGTGDVNTWDYCYSPTNKGTGCTDVNDCSGNPCVTPGYSSKGPSSPSRLLRFPPISQYLLEPASVVWALQFGC